MNPSLRPLGLAMSLFGNLLFAVGFGGLIGRVNALDADSFTWVTAMDAVKPAVMLGLGYLLARFAPRYGGGSIGVQFLVIGLTSTWSALHAQDGVERFVGALVGGSFLLASVIGLVGIAMAYGWSHSLTHPSPTIFSGGVVQPLNAANLATALRQVATLQATGGLDPEAIARARTVAPTADALTPEQRSQVLQQIERLQASGQLSAEQVNAIKAWWGDDSPSGS